MRGKARAIRAVWFRRCFSPQAWRGIGSAGARSDWMSDYFIADDLSGALDAAAAFHHAGRRVMVALSTEAWPDAGKDGVVGITTETRNASAAHAAQVVGSVVE